MFLAFVLALLCSASVLASGVVNSETPSIERDVFVSGEGGYFCYKIPTIFQAFDGTLLAFSEARGGECWDWDATDLVLSRSIDAGLNWSTPEVLIPGLFESHRVAGNIAPVQDRTTGRIYLPFNRGNFEAWLTYSDDNGLTWEEPTQLLGLLDPSWMWIGFGPPAGLQSITGRLIVPAYASSALIYDNGLLTSAFVVYSDDHGATWKVSDLVPNGLFPFINGILGNENQVAQFEDGELLMNARTIFGERILSRSTDDGETWTQFERALDLPNPGFGCEGSLIIQKLANGTEVVLFSAPDSTSTLRLDMTIWSSIDRGESWQKIRLVEEGQVGYSSLLHMHNGKLAILYGYSEETAVLFIPGVIRLKIFDTSVNYTAPLPSFPSQSHNTSWILDNTSIDYFESSAYYALVVINQIVGIIAFLVLVCFCMFCCAGVCCRSNCERRIPKLQPVTSFLDFDERLEVVNKVVISICIIGAWILFFIGFLANLVQYLFKYDDPERYVRQTLNGLFVGYISTVAVVVYYSIFLYFLRILQKKRRESDLDKTPTAKVDDD